MNTISIGKHHVRGLSVSRFTLRQLAFLFFVCSASSFAQTTYYVANNGNDGNDGRSGNSPFQSIAKVNSLNLRAGDVVLFRRGDTFRGDLLIRQSGGSGNPIRFDAYGDGTKPSLSGAARITNWTNIGGNIWQAPCPDCGSRVTGVYRNGSPLPLGRYPNLNAGNKGYLTIQSHSGKTQLTSQQGLGTNWTGGEAVVRPQQWILDRATITQQNGNTLNLANSSNYDLSDGWGYFIQNHPATLDQTGEWYYNPNARTLQLYYDQGNPNDQTITATAFDEAINIANVSNITIQNLQITQARTTNLYVVNVSNLTVTNNDITNAGEDAVKVDGGGSNLLFENNQLYKVNNNGIIISPYQNVTFRGNTVRAIGLVPGRGRSGDGQSLGLLFYSNVNTLIENNVLDSIGYNGIGFWNNTTIQRNMVSNFCLTKSDGGGIYVHNGNKQDMSNIHLLSNIVYNGIGAPEGSPANAYNGANGIYLDDCSQNIEVSNNTVFNCLGLGIYLHSTSNITVTNNTIYNNREGQLLLNSNHGVCLPRGNTIQNNVFVSKLTSQPVVRFESDQNDLGSYGNFDNNVYARPFDDQFTISAVYNNGSGVSGSDLALSQWQSQFQKDWNSKKSPLTFQSNITSAGTGAVSKLSTAFAGSNEGWSIWSPYGNGQDNWSNSGQLDGGSLLVNFPQGSGHSDSYAVVFNNIGAVKQGRKYRFQFDAQASGPNKQVQAFIRQLSGSYQDLDKRLSIAVGTGRQHYDVTFTASMDEANAIAVFQVGEDGQNVWFDNISIQDVSGGTSTLVGARINNTFANTSEGWSSWGPYGNGQANWTNNGQLDGGNLQVNFPQGSGHSDSYVIIFNGMGAVSKGKSYQLQFDAVASGANKKVQAFIRQLNGSYQDLDKRFNVLTGTSRQTYTVTFTASMDEANAILLFQIDEDGKTLWLDNIRLQEVTTTVANPDDYIQFVYNPTFGNTTVSLNGNYRDARNKVYSGQVTLSPFTSLVLLKDGGQSGARTAADVTPLMTYANPEVSVVYPNPAIDEFTFVPEKPVQQLQVIDMTGHARLVLDAVPQGEPVRFGRQLPTGQYLLNIQYGTGEQRAVKLLKIAR